MSTWDPLSAHRSAIEPHEQNHPGMTGGLDVLIDAGRDSIEFLLSNDYEAALGLRRQWAASEVRILNRLATHAVRVDPRMSADEKIDWLLAHEYLFAPGMKHEALKLLEAAYPEAQEGTRMKALERVDVGLTGDVAEGLEEETRVYVKYNVLVWLSKVAPDHRPTRELLERIKGAHPDFEPREHPDFDSWISTGYVGPQIDVSADDLLRKDPEADEDFDWLMRFFAGEGAKWDVDKWGRAERFSEAAFRQFEWGAKLARRLRDSSLFDSELWSTLVEGWTKRSMPPTSGVRALSSSRRTSTSAPMPTPSHGGLRKVSRSRRARSLTN